MNTQIIMSNQNIWATRRQERHKQELRAQITRFLLNPNIRDTVLDLGCAEGFVTKRLLGASYVVGVDTSKGSLLLAKQKVKGLNIDFICADGANLPLKEASFNKAIMLEVLEHLPKETQNKICNEFDRALKRESIIVISIPYRERITYTRCVHCGKLTPLWGHLCSMDEEKVTNLLPSHYTLITRCHIFNIGLISSAQPFAIFPLRLWLALNNMLGKIRKGYWLLLKYKKMT